ncbi:hypothetical protein EMCRGX_G030622 [Ephydatia muelleri]
MSPQLTECRTSPTLGIWDHLSGAYGPQLQGLQHQPRHNSLKMAEQSGCQRVWCLSTLTLRSQLGDQEDQEQYQGRMGTSTDQKYPTPATT